MEQQQKHRPLGITIIAILTIIDGISEVSKFMSLFVYYMS